MKINNLSSLRTEIRQLSYKSKLNKEKMISEIKLLPYHLIKELLKNLDTIFRK